ncbi:unnamed protein product [Spirodela intermedia]|uniref:adenine phosphoribosyltransferase n=1 Tax=Spirodela intermedia TaxID=51605 RepID=A0A7I8JQV6_SPIIN|nr:unnamed protein product [Spirodela intermedia]CAA6672567.1 unnamed protein product [Spirodela intermedia]
MVERGGGGGGENGVAAPPVADGAVPVAGVEDPRLQGISAAIRVVPHFPKPGIMFNDITTLLLRPKVFKDTVDILVERYRGMGISIVAGIEARGFIFGPPVALALGAKFVPLRKPKKLPGQVISENYVLEYGTDCLEMHVGAVQPGEHALIIDDLVATGGHFAQQSGFWVLNPTIDSSCSSIDLLSCLSFFQRAGAEVDECACIIGLPKFKGRCKLNGKPVYILVECRQ